MAYDLQAGDDLHGPGDPSNRESDVIPVVVEQGETAETTEDDGQPFESGYQVLVNKRPEIFQAGGHGLIPPLVTLRISTASTRFDRPTVAGDGIRVVFCQGTYTFSQLVY